MFVYSVEPEILEEFGFEKIYEGGK